MNNIPNYSEVLRRHALPEILFHPDIALVLNLTLEQAEERARAGQLGHEFYVGGRVAVLRQDFLDTLAELGEADDEAAKELLGARLRAVSGEPERGCEEQRP